jgi:hypothetical protein
VNIVQKVKPLNVVPEPDESANEIHIRELVRAGAFDEALVFLANGGCNEFSGLDWSKSPLDRGRTPIAFICSGQCKKDVHDIESGNPKANETIQALIKAGCPLDAVDGNGYTALSYAANRLDARKVEILLAAGAHPDSPGARFSPLASALMNPNGGSSAIAWILMRAGASVDQKTVDRHGAERLSTLEFIAELNAKYDANIDSSPLVAFQEWESLMQDFGSSNVKSAPSFSL